jgi:tetratricopeptide (TPR) repeat protein
MMFTTSTPFDTKGEAAKLSSQAEKARMFGNMREASELHARAGKVLEADVVNKIKRADKDVIRFLAATQYYLGGHYAKAEEVCRKIQGNKLHERERSLYPTFLKAVHERAKPDYVRRIRKQIECNHENGNYEQILDLLKEHLYVIPDDGMLAAVRGFCCERLKKYDIAALFFSDALRKSPDNDNLVVYSATAPLQLVPEKHLADAWAFANDLLAKIPHPLTYLAASIIRFYQAVETADAVSRRRFYEEQAQLFGKAESRLHELPSSLRRQASYRELLLQCYAAAMKAYVALGQVAAAKDALERATAFAPDDSFFHELAENMKSPNPETAEHFRTMIEDNDRVARTIARLPSLFEQLAA